MNAVTGIILAGGKSSRMGSDKGLVLYKDKPMVQQVIDAMLPVCNSILIVTNANEYDVFGLKRIADEQSDYGPVMGIYSALKESNATCNLVLSCDVPNVKTELLSQLIERLDDHDVSLATDGEKMHPLIAAYHIKTLKAFEDAIQLDEHRLLNVVEQMNKHLVKVEDHEREQLKNINTPKELEACV